MLTPMSALEILWGKQKRKKSCDLDVQFIWSLCFGHPCPWKMFSASKLFKTHNYSLCKRDKSTGTHSSRGCHLSRQLRQHVSGLLGWKNSIKSFLVEKCLEVSLAPHVPSTLLLFIKPLPPPSAEPSMGCFLASAPSLMELKWDTDH